MSKTRLHVDGPIAVGTNITLSGDRARYINRVLRLGPNDEVTLFDGSGSEYRAVIRVAGRNTVGAAIEEEIGRSTKSPLIVTLLQGISRGDRMDYVIQKATELGVSRISPIHTEFSMVKLDEKRAAKRMQHWRNVATSACEQCGRNDLPLLDPPTTLRSILGTYREASSPKVIMKPGASTTLASIDIGESDPIVLIGPEGGFSDQEYENAEAAGFEEVGFGPRVLRTETAAVAVITALQVLYGDLA
jgi:16S rRNA (uracil1498-N3)-methyltransferase